MSSKRRKPLWRFMGPNKVFAPVQQFGTRGWAMDFTFWHWKSFPEFGPFHLMVLRRGSHEEHPTD